MGLRAGDWWSGRAEEQLAEMDFVYSHIILGLVAGVRLAADFSADCDLCRKTNNGDSDTVYRQVEYRVTYIARVIGKEGTVDDENLTRVVSWSMTIIESTPVSKALYKERTLAVKDSR